MIPSNFAKVFESATYGQIVVMALEDNNVPFVRYYAKPHNVTCTAFIPFSDSDDGRLCRDDYFDSINAEVAEDAAKKMFDLEAELFDAEQKKEHKNNRCLGGNVYRIH